MGIVQPQPQVPGTISASDHWTSSLPAPWAHGCFQMHPVGLGMRRATGRGPNLPGGTDGLSLPMAAAVAPVQKLLQSANFHYAKHWKLVCWKSHFIITYTNLILNGNRVIKWNSISLGLFLNHILTTFSFLHLSNFYADHLPAANTWEAEPSRLTQEKVTRFKEDLCLSLSLCRNPAWGPEPSFVWG